MKIRRRYTCPLEIVHDFLRGKWKTIILYQLKNGPKSLSELEKCIVGINQKMLIQDLADLIEFQVVNKIKYEGYPLKVEYSLTAERGQRIIEAINILQSIGKEYMNENRMKI